LSLLNSRRAVVAVIMECRSNYLIFQNGTEYL
jgi:hypothetical protein